MIQETQVRDFQLPDFLTRKEETALLEVCKNPTEKFRILYLADTGARISEALKSKIGHMDAVNRKVKIPTLKKRGKEQEYRSLDMSDRLYDAYIDYWKELKKRKAEDWLFPSPDDPNYPLRRQAVNKMLNKKAKKAGLAKNIHPHLFRHSFGTRLAAEKVPMHVIQYLLGHESITSTQIYTHVTPELLRIAMQSIDDEKWWLKWKRRLFLKPNRVGALPIQQGQLKFIVGRKKELAQLLDLGTKKRNVLLTGVPGIGKSVLLDNYSTGKILRIQDLRGGNKKVLGNILLWLYDGDKEEILQMIYPPDNYQFDKVVNREKEKELMKLIEKVTKPKEYTLIIDTLDQINKTTGHLIERMKQHFHIIAAAREIKVDYLHTFSNFTKLELQPLSRAESTLMIEKLTDPFRNHIEDFELLVNNVYRQTNGNPQYISELIDAFKAEGDFSKQTLETIQHTASQKPIDMTIAFVLLLSSIMVIRYLGGEMGDDSGAFRFIGGAFMVFALFSRLFMNLGKRRYV